MNLRCLYCQTPFTLSRVEMLSALVIMNEKNQNHYDAHCPRCRRANSISRQRMELFFPNWREAAKQQAAAAEAAAESRPWTINGESPIENTAARSSGRITCSRNFAAVSCWNLYIGLVVAETSKSNAISSGT